MTKKMSEEVTQMCNLSWGIYQDGYEERVKDILCMMIAESTASFERLPCLVDVDILRNILYDGVWNRYNRIQMKKSEDQKNDEKPI